MSTVEVSRLQAVIEVLGAERSEAALDRFHTKVNAAGRGSATAADGIAKAERETAKLAAAQGHAAASMGSAATVADKLGYSKKGLTKEALALSTTMVGVGAAVAGAGVLFDKTVGSAARLEEEINAIASIKPDIDTENVTAEVTEMTRRVNQSAGQIAASLYDIHSSMDVTEAEGLRLAEIFAKGAVAARTDAATFGTAVTGVLNAYKLDISEATRVSDIFFNTVALGVVTGEELARGLGPITQNAKAAGVPMEQLGGFIAGVTKEGGPAAQNLNNLSNTLSKFTTKDAQNEFKALGISVVDSTGNFRPLLAVFTDLKARIAGLGEAEQLNIIQRIFPDAQARQGAQTIISQLDFIRDAIQKNEAAAGETERAYERMSSGSAAQWKSLQNNIAATGTEIGTKLLPQVNELTEDLGALYRDAGKKITVTVDIIRTVNGKVEDVTGGTGLDDILRKAGRIASGQDDLAGDRGILGGLAEKLGIVDAKSREAAGGMALTTEQADKLGVSALQAAGVIGVATEKVNPFKDAMLATTASLAGANAELPKAATTTAAVGAAASASGPNVATLNTLLGVTGDEAKTAAEYLELARKGVSNLTSEATGAEQVLSRQGHAIEAVQSNAAALASGLKRGGQEVAVFGQQARDAAQHIGLTEDQMGQLNLALADVEKGGPAAERGLKAIDNLLKPLAADMGAANKAYADSRQLTGDLAQEQLGLGRSMDGLKGAVQDLVVAFQTGMGQIPTVVAEAASKVGDTLVIDSTKPGAEVATKYATAIATGLGASHVEIRNATGVLMKASVAEAQSYDAILRATGSSLGQALASGFAVGAIVNAAMAAESARLVAQGGVKAITTEIRAESPSRVTRQRGMWFTEGFALGILDKKDVAEEAAGSVAADATDHFVGNLAALPDAVSDTAAAIAASFSPAGRQLTAELARVDLQLAQLKTALADAAPESAQAASIQKLIDNLERYRGQLAATQDEQRALNDLMEASRTAADGYREAMADLGRDMKLAEQFGEAGAAAIAALRDAVKEGTPEAGATAARAAQEIVDAAKAAGVQGWGDLGDALHDALRDAIESGTPQSVQAALDLIDQMNRATTKAAPVTGFWEALLASERLSGYQARFGDAGAAVAEALTTAMAERTKENGARLSGTLADITKELEASGLPDWRELGQTLTAAFANALRDGSPDAAAAALAVLDDVTRRMESSFPRVLAKIKDLVSRGTQELALAARDGAGFDAILGEVGRLGTLGGFQNDGTAILASLNRIMEVGQRIGIPPAVLASVRELSISYIGSRDAARATAAEVERLTTAQKALDAASKAYDRGIAQNNRRLADLNAVDSNPFKTDAERAGMSDAERAKYERDAERWILQQQVETSNRAKAAIAEEKEALEEQKRALEGNVDPLQKIAALLEPFIERTSAAADATKKYLDFLGLSAEAMDPTLASNLELTTSINTLIGTLGGVPPVLGAASKAMAGTATGTAAAGGEYVRFTGYIDGALDRINGYNRELMTNTSLTNEQRAALQGKIAQETRNIQLWDEQRQKVNAATGALATNAQASAGAGKAAEVAAGKTGEYTSAVKAQFDMITGLAPQAKGGGAYLAFEFVAGFTDGMRDGEGPLADAARKGMAAFLAAAKDTLGIHSPSTEGAAMGDNVGDAYGSHLVTKANEYGQQLFEDTKDGMERLARIAADFSRPGRNVSEVDVMREVELAGLKAAAGGAGPNAQSAGVSDRWLAESGMGARLDERRVAEETAAIRQKMIEDEHKANEEGLRLWRLARYEEERAEIDRRAALMEEVAKQDLLAGQGMRAPEGWTGIDPARYRNTTDGGSAGPFGITIPPGGFGGGSVPPRPPAPVVNVVVQLDGQEIAARVITRVPEMQRRRIGG